MRIPHEHDQGVEASFMVVDVRPYDTWLQGPRIATSFNIPARELVNRTNEFPPKEQAVLFLVIGSGRLSRFLQKLTAAEELEQPEEEEPMEELADDEFPAPPPPPGVSVADIVAAMDIEVDRLRMEGCTPVSDEFEGVDSTDEWVAIRYLFQGRWPVESVHTLQETLSIVGGASTSGDDASSTQQPSMSFSPAGGDDSSKQRGGGGGPPAVVDGQSVVVTPPHRRAWKVDVGRSNWTQCYPPPRMWSPCPFLLEQIDTIEQRIGGPGVCLDVGCGSGRDMAFLAARGWEVVGIDNRRKLVEQAMSFARKYTKHPATGRTQGRSVGTLEGTLRAHLPVRPRSVDLLLVVRFLHRPLLPALVSCLRDGGVVLYSHFVDGVQHTPIGHPKTMDGYLLHSELTQYFCTEPEPEPAVAQKSSQQQEHGEEQQDGEESSSEDSMPPLEPNETDTTAEMTATAPVMATTASVPPVERRRVVTVVSDDEAVISDGRPIVNFLAQVHYVECLGVTTCSTD